MVVHPATIGIGGGKISIKAMVEADRPGPSSFAPAKRLPRGSDGGLSEHGVDASSSYQYRWPGPALCHSLAKVRP
jgi:hypothetical protein